LIYSSYYNLAYIHYTHSCVFRDWVLNCLFPKRWITTGLFCLVFYGASISQL
jgi:hypothetical protein